MTLLVFRHGHDLRMNGAAENSLSRQGREQVAHTVTAFKSLHDTPVSRVLTSPALRAVETAEIIAAALGGFSVEQTDGLRWSSTSDQLDALVGRVDSLPGELTVLVGHEPNLGNAILRWSGRPENDPEDTSRLNWTLARGSAALLTPSLSHGVLRVDPATISLIGVGVRPLPLPNEKRAAPSPFG